MIIRKVGVVAAALAAIGIGIELLARSVTPPWPVYMLRPQPISAEEISLWQAGMPDAVFATNSWSMRDRERTVAKPQGVSARALFVGDSVLDGTFTRMPLPLRIERELAKQGRADVEAVNLGVTSTGPREYYYRLREVGLMLSPDAVVMMFFSGNDFLYQRFDGEPSVPPFIDDLPLPSLLGAVAPHATWLARVRTPRAGVRGEMQLIDDAVRRPAAERVSLLARHMKHHYFPQLDEARIGSILSRGDEGFWQAFALRQRDREILPAQVLQQMIVSATEAADDQPSDSATAVDVEAALSWISASERLARSRGIPFLVALAPPATVDPAFVEFWKPWPRYVRYSLRRDADHKALAGALARASIAVADLRDDLGGVRDTYRKTDTHWTEIGNDIVAARLAREVIALKR